MSYRRLSYGFRVRCNEPTIREYLTGVLKRFTVEDGLSESWPTYHVLDLGPAEPNRYRLLIDDTWILGGSDLDLVLDELFTQMNLGTFESARDRVLVHAGAVVTPQGAGVVLPAPSGSGKSTLVAGLVRAGFGYLSDEAAVLDPTTGELHPYQVNISLKDGSRDRFADTRHHVVAPPSTGETWYVDPDAIRPDAVASSCQVGFVIPHRYEPGAQTRVEPLTPAESCIDLSQNLMLGRRAVGSSIDLLAHVCCRSRSYRLTHGDLDAAVQAIVELTRS